MSNTMNINHNLAESYNSTEFDKMLITEGNTCFEEYKSKLFKYGASWRLFSASTMIQQLLIKVNRLRNHFALGYEFKVDETAEDGFRAICNYAVIATMQGSLLYTNRVDNSEKALQDYSTEYKAITEEFRDIMVNKNTDYGSAWTNFNLLNFVELIAVKLNRAQNIALDAEHNVDDLKEVYVDCYAYALYALIMIDSAKTLTAKAY